MFLKKNKNQSNPPRQRQRVNGQSQSSTAPVFSYHAARSGPNDARGRQLLAEEKPARLRRPRPRWLSPKNLGLAVIILLVFMACMSLSRTPKIVVVGDTNNKLFLRDTTQYQQAAEKALASSMANGNKLTINTSVIAQSLEEQFPEIRTVSISLPILGRQPIVYVQPAVPQMILATQSGQFVLDSSGRALAAVSPGLSLPTGDQSLPLVTDESGLPAKAGTVVLPQQSVSFIAQVSGQLKAQHIAVSSWRLPARASELDAAIAGKPYRVRFNLQGSARAEVGTFVAAKQYLEARNKTPSQYIDVRVSGRSYYK